MIYPDSFEHKVGFDAIRTRLEQSCLSALGLENVRDMTFCSDFGTVERQLKSTAQMLSVLNGDKAFPLEGLNDCRAILQNLKIPGSFASEEQLVAIRKNLEAIRAVSKFFSDLRKEESDGRITSPYPELDAISRDLATFPEILIAINRILDLNGQVKDNASTTLFDIRRRMASMAGSINSAMRRVIARASSEGLIEPDTTPSVRDGRLVVPVAPMYKRKISGIVHDESASGKTVFIEPAEVVEANNRLRELMAEERREVTRILIDLADSIRPEAAEIIDELHVMGLFEFIYIKARFAKSIGASLPHLSSKPELEWYHAVHPVLDANLRRQGKITVPLDIHLTPEKRLLVISGPNAGGKSVTLKTVATIQYMLQCGLLPPVYENSHMGMMDSIFIDIGDDQSIEDDLSTYSSHLRNMKQFVQGGTSSTLVLIDEFGTGTEPQIGGAIAQAVLKQLNEQGVWGVITTHYHNLKEFAEHTPGLVNGSMLYDRQRMQPQFKLAIGQPGSSFALEIAAKTGLPSSIIETAKELVGKDYVNMDKYLLDIARDRRYWENKRQDIRRKEKQIEDILTRYDSELEQLRGKRREIISEARNEARKILDGSNAAIERTIREIRSAEAEKQKTMEAREKLAQEAKALTSSPKEADALSRKIPRSKKAKPQTAPKQTDRPIQEGDSVVLKGGGTTVGTVESISGNNAVVVFGLMKTTVKLNRLERSLRKPTEVKKENSYLSSQTTEASRARQLDFHSEIDVRGMRADEAVQAVMYFIDDAIQFNAGRVRILHGTGTGALRQYIRNYLETVPAVTNFHDEDVRLGGTGITVVEL